MAFDNENTLLSHIQDGSEDKYDANYEDAVKTVQKKRLGKTHHLRIAGKEVKTDDTFDVTSPNDSELVVGTFAAGTSEHVSDAVAAAKDAFDPWRTTSYERRAEIFEKAAELMRKDKWELAAIMTFENGKTRHEALADVDEAIDFLRFYAAELRRHKGYTYDTGNPTPPEHCTNVLRPYGVFAVISPFNFPLAILVGMTTGALITGNTAVVKPASATPLIAHAFFDILEAAGLPDGVANLVTGTGRDVGQPLVEHADVEGVVFTGSREVGLKTQKTFFEMGKRGPVIAELGGKNATIITANADLDKAVPGVMNAAFGFGGQKCSACSRVYVDRTVASEFIGRLVEETNTLVVGPPQDKDTFLGPVIDTKAVDTFLDAAKKAEADGNLMTGGTRVTDGELERGTYVRPAIVTGLPDDHELVRTELFLPFVSIHEVDSLDEALAKANDSEYALTSGFYSEDGDEVATYLDRIEAGVVYVNRARSSSTGALVQGQPFGGWKFSGTTGKFAGGYWYLPQFMKEQTRTVVKE